MASNDKSSDSFLIVGIGASAGGLEAFQTFFRHMDENSDMAFVLISHLAPNHESLLSELLAKETKMNVMQVREETTVQPNQVYVIPPNADLTINGGKLYLSEPIEARGHRAPIDVFFRSLAEDQGENAVCVILSGTGSDGTLGLKAIKECSGLAIAQDSKTANYDSMPRSAVLTGLIDYVLPVEEIPAKLIDYARHRDGLRVNLGERGFFAETADHLGQICALLRRRLGHDFSSYKQNTLIRRIQRRIQINQVGSVAAYLEYLKSDPEEVNLLFKDLLIGVTHFFRNPESFAALKQKVIVPLVENSKANGHPIRIWVAGCSSGEEAYSLAILVAEEMERQEANLQVHIFATDIDGQALERARQSRYPNSITEQILPERLERFFVKQSGFYQVTKKLREMCIFSEHSLINDPPFSRLDLVSCRNLLIYFDTELQRRLLPLFHYSLKPGGHLFLGSSENLTGHNELFRTLDKQHRIFQQKQTMKPPQVEFPLIDPSNYRRFGLADRQTYADRRQQVNRAIERVLLQDYAPACVIIDEQHEIVYFYGRTGKYLEPPPGPPSNDLFTLARRGLRLDLRAAVQAANETQKEVVRERISIETDKQIQFVNLIVRPVKEIAEDSSLLMIIFQDVVDASSISYGEEREEIEEETEAVQHLENELRTVKEHLRSTIEELETSNEELKSANEELLSMNEELQSSNEELQTSKEEMQSINEELETVNGELRNKIEELDAANSDVQNLFESTRIATVFLDLNLNIKKFTPAATSLFNFIGTDIGRPITDISLSLAEVDIVRDVREVVQTLVPIERDICLAERDRHYKMRILPYRTVENVIDGAVITFVDITSLQQARARAEQAARQQRAIAELGIYALQSNDVRATCDRAIQLVCQTLNSDLCGLYVLQNEEGLTTTNRLVLKRGNGWQFENRDANNIVAVDSHPGYTLAVRHPVIVENFASETRFNPLELPQELQATSGISAIVYGSEGPYGVLATYTLAIRKFTSEDVSFLQAIANGLGAIIQREKTVEALAKSRERLDLALSAGNMGVWELNIDSGLSTWSQMEYELLGLEPNDIQVPSENLFYSYVLPDDTPGVRRELERAIARKAEFNAEFRINRADGELRWLAAHARVISNANGEPVKVIGVNYDITERKRNEEALQAADRRKDKFLATLGHELRNPLNAIVNSIELMAKLEGSDRLAQLCRIATRQSKHLSHLVDDLLEASRITYGKIQLCCQPLNLTQLLHQSIEDCHRSLRAKELNFSLNLPEKSIWTYGDPVRLTQAFTNILHNAVKFSYPEGRIEICMFANEGKIVIEVADNGMGIESEAISRIFIAFSQENRDLARSEGLGLGLSVTKGIIELHEGKIAIESAGRDRGTTVTIELPQLDERDLETAKLPSKTDSEKVQSDGASITNSDRGRILIIEDESDSAFLIQTFMENLGYRVEVAVDGVSGIELARQFAPNIILSDISLTEAMDGYALARAIREDPQLNSIYLIAISGYGQPEDKERAKAAGFDEHLTKPLDLALVRSSIDKKMSDWENEGG